MKVEQNNELRCGKCGKPIFCIHTDRQMLKCLSCGHEMPISVDRSVVNEYLYSVAQKYLRSGYSVRSTSRMTQLSPMTVSRINKKMNSDVRYNENDTTCPHCGGSITPHSSGDKTIYWCDNCGSNNRYEKPSVNVV